jgi:hypothetical protein
MVKDFRTQLLRWIKDFSSRFTHGRAAYISLIIYLALGVFLVYLSSCTYLLFKNR